MLVQVAGAQLPQVPAVQLAFPSSGSVLPSEPCKQILRCTSLALPGSLLEDPIQIQGPFLFNHTFAGLFIVFFVINVITFAAVVCHLAASSVCAKTVEPGSQPGSL